MREQQAQITEIIVGPTELFVSAWCKSPQYNEHCLGWKHAQFMADCKIRHARVREAERAIIARIGARNEVAYQEAAE